MKRHEIVKFTTHNRLVGAALSFLPFTGAGP